MDSEVTGLKELDKALKDFSAKLEGAIVRGGLRAGTTVFLKRARAHINSRSGELSKSLRIRTKAKRGKVSATLVAGNAKAYYPHMVEFGTASHFISAEAGGENVAAKINRRAGRNAKALQFGGAVVSSVEHPGSQPRPFMRPALDGGQQEAVEAMAEYIRNRIRKEKAR